MGLENLGDILKKACSKKLFGDDRHVTLLGFTTGWKACLGTICLDSGWGRVEVRYLPAFDSPEEAMLWAIHHPNALDEIRHVLRGSRRTPFDFHVNEDMPPVHFKEER